MTDIEIVDTEAPKRGRPPKAVAGANEKLCRVLKNGAGKIAKGFTVVEADGQLREQYFEKGDEFIIAASIADALEDRGFVEA